MRALEQTGSSRPAQVTAAWRPLQPFPANAAVLESGRMIEGRLWPTRARSGIPLAGTLKTDRRPLRSGPPNAAVLERTPCGRSSFGDHGWIPDLHGYAAPRRDTGNCPDVTARGHSGRPALRKPSMKRARSFGRRNGGATFSTLDSRKLGSISSSRAIASCASTILSDRA